MPQLQKLKSTQIPRYEPVNILRIQAHSNYSKIYFTDRPTTLVVSKVLHLVQANLPADMFVRVHRSHLVNRLFIKSVSGTHIKTVELSNGEYIPVSRRKQAAFNYA